MFINSERNDMDSQYKFRMHFLFKNGRVAPEELALKMWLSENAPDNGHDHESDRGGTPKIIQLIRQAQGLAANPEEESALRKLTPHVPGIVTFADHSKQLPWSTSYTTVLMFADISGFTSLCECYSAMENAGIDQLTKTLNDYLGTIVEGIVYAEGDVLKFAGDAILSVWRVNKPEELSATVDRVIKCCLEIQEKCGEWETDIGVTLSVKMGVASGKMTVTFIGNDEFRAYVELGSAVTDVNTAESFCMSGFIVLSPTAWDLCTKYFYDYEVMSDDSHVRIISYRKVQTTPDKSKSNDSQTKEPNPWFVRKRRTSHGWGVTVTGLTAISAFAAGRSNVPWTPPDTATPSSSAGSINSTRHKSTISDKEEESIDEKIGNHETVVSRVASPISSIPESTKSSKPEEKKPGVKKKFGLSKLKNVVKTVTAMRLDESLRLYILLPVLQKLDDNQPLEYLSEMRQVTVVFMNMVLDDQLDTTNLLQEIFEIVYSQSKVMRGCLNKVFLFDKGCTFLVLFGLPGYKHEKDCTHALICSQKMRNILIDVSGVRRVSIGVTTGATFCGVVGHKNRHEYSVIGRKVNMAARLMMHYPDKVTCDDNTFQSSRLPASNFETLATKRMKGLKNVGVIREYIEEKEIGGTLELASIHHFPFPVLGREPESELFKIEIQKLKQGAKTEEMNHYILCGVSGIGKTRLMDHFIIMAEREDIRVISCALTIQNSHIRNFLTRHILRMLLSSAGFSHHVDNEPEILEVLKSEGLFDHLYLINTILQTKFPKPDSDVLSEKDRVTILYNIFLSIVRTCVTKHEAVVLAVDDAQNMDDASWLFLHKCLSVPHLLVVISSRPAIIEKPSCEAAREFIEDNLVRVHDLGSLDTRYTAALACQLMDVVRIPRQLERMLRERSQGVPYWCEQLLIEMAEKKQILIVIDNGTYKDTIAPASAQIRRLSIHSTEAEEEDDIEIRRINSVFKLQQDDTSTTAEMLQAWGMSVTNRQSIGSASSKRPQRIAILNPLIDPEEIPIPTQMKEFITARLDSMRASEQLIVKCATVLGKTIPRDMIESILPNIPRVKARRSFKRLMQIGIFECANTPTGRAGLFVQHSNSNPALCYCPKMEDDFDADLCNLMRFKNQLLQDTAYDVLMESQKLELHAKAAQYLDREADKLRNHIPFYLLNRDPPVSLKEIEANSKDVSAVLERDTFANRTRKGSRDNKVSDLAMEYNKARRSRRPAVVVEKEDVDHLLKAVLKMEGTTERAEDLARRLQPYYEQIYRHWMAAKKPTNVAYVLLEAVSSAIIIKDAQKARILMDDLENVLHDKNMSEEITADVLVKSKILRLRGKIENLLGHQDAAMTLIQQAAELLGLSQPRNKLETWLMSFQYCFRLRMLRRSNSERPPATKKTLEQGLCLSDLYSLYRERGEERLLFITALRQMIKITGRICHLHQVVQAYSGTIQLFRIQGKAIKSELENELFTNCAARYKELSAEDLGILAKLYTDMSMSLLNDGNINRSYVTGIGAFEICDRINEQQIGQEVAPIVAMSLIQSCRDEEFSSFLQKFKSFTSTSDQKTPRAWFYSFCMERMLNGDFPLQTFQSCLDFATSYLKAGDAVRYEFLPRYFIAMTIAVWFCRKGHWEKAQTWFDYWETYEPELNTFLALYAFSRKIEVMLLSLCTCRKTKTRQVWKDLGYTVQKDLGILELQTKKIRGMRARYHHLRAYFNMLRETPFLAKLHLRRATECAKDQGNVLERKWVQKHQLMWFTETQGDESDIWSSLTSKHIMEWRLKSTLSTESQLFTWPVRSL